MWGTLPNNKLVFIYSWARLYHRPKVSEVQVLVLLDLMSNKDRTINWPPNGKGGLKSDQRCVTKIRPSSYFYFCFISIFLNKTPRGIRKKGNPREHRPKGQPRQARQPEKGQTPKGATSKEEIHL